MNCHELREIMSRSVDGGLDSRTRKEVGLHLAGCQECLRLISEDKFWDDAVIALLDREAPADLRAEILGDLSTQSEFSKLGWKKQLRLMAWGARRKNMNLRQWLETLVIVAGVLWLLPLIIKLWFGSN